VTCVKWGGTGLIYTASYDRTVIVWDARAGTLVHHLRSHVARINHLALSTDFVLRTGFFDHTKNVPKDDAARRAKARDRFEKAAHVAGKVSEKLVSASDDNTMFLWDPMNQGKKPVVRMLGHQNKVMHVSFSPDATLVASACWDKQIKTWDATYVPSSVGLDLLLTTLPVMANGFARSGATSVLSTNVRFRQILGSLRQGLKTRRSRCGMW